MIRWIITDVAQFLYLVVNEDDKFSEIKMSLSEVKVKFGKDYSGLQLE